MRGIAGAVAAGVVVLAATGCAHTQLTHWTGVNISSVVEELGPPTRTVALNKGTIYVWDKTRDNLAVTTNPADRSTVGVAWQYMRWTFLVDRVGTIESWGYSEAAQPDLLQRTVMGPS
jgi:hypothetical protein